MNKPFIGKDRTSRSLWYVCFGPGDYEWFDSQPAAIEWANATLKSWVRKAFEGH